TCMKKRWRSPSTAFPIPSATDGRATANLNVRDGCPRFAKAYLGRKRRWRSHPPLHSLSFRKKQTHLCRLRWRCQSTHHHKANQSSDQSRKDSIPLRQHRRQVPFHHIKIPEKSDHRPHRNSAHRTLGIRAPAIKRGQDNRRERSGVNRIGIES